MDVSNRKIELKTEILLPKSEDHTEITATKSIKRPFDVAFLMQPDEKLKQKQLRIAAEAPVYSSKSDSDEDIEVGTDSSSPKTDFPNKTKYFQSQKQQIFDDPKPKISFDCNLPATIKIKTALNMSPDQKSAFTKVSLNKESRTSPNLSLSPDLNYQNSLSPSPPIIPRNYQSFPPNMHLFKTQSQTSSAYQNNFMPENPFANTPEILQPNFKMRPMLNYRPELPYNYSQFQPQDMIKISQPDIRNPAAAILHTLFPPSLAALSLPAQNVCAKCNITFRMTSDLVYHMRSHHKNDSVDYSKKRREDKLKCPVCAESFRERHHLTRHMTAHQDKDNDGLEPETKKKNYAAAYNK